VCLSGIDILCKRYLLISDHVYMYNHHLYLDSTEIDAQIPFVITMTELIRITDYILIPTATLITI